MPLPFFISFLLSSVYLSFLILGILFIKRVFTKHICGEFQYVLSFMILFSLLLPFLPVQEGPVPMHEPQTFTRSLTHLGNTSKAYLLENVLPNDFAISVSHISFDTLNSILAVIWLSGMLIMCLLFSIGHHKISLLRHCAALTSDPILLSLFEQCKKDLGIHRSITLYHSPATDSPMTFGLLHPCILLPYSIKTTCTPQEIYYILLHELQHYKHKDVFTSYLMSFFHIIYWFHPLVWYALKEMRIDREIACDLSVLKCIKEDQYIAYGHTLIHFASHLSRSTYFTSSSRLGGPRTQIKKRIIHISSFNPKAKWTRLKSFAIFIFMLFLVSTSAPYLSISAAQPQMYTQPISATYPDDLSHYFKGYTGSFVLYDLQADTYQIYNPNEVRKRVSPNSTIKPYIALFALDSGKISPQTSTLTWDGTPYPFTLWNKDQDLKTAMLHSTNWYFQNLDKQIGIASLEAYYTQIGYGNLDFSGGLSEYWLESSLKISPIEQVLLLKDLYLNTFHFKENHIQAVKNALYLSSSTKGQLYGKTGTGKVNNKNVNGWFIGYVQQSDNTYFFATHIEGPDHALGSVASEITSAILKDKKIYIP